MKKNVYFIVLLLLLSVSWPLKIQAQTTGYGQISIEGVFVKQKNSQSNHLQTKKRSRLPKLGSDKTSSAWLSFLGVLLILIVYELSCFRGEFYEKK